MIFQKCHKFRPRGDKGLLAKITTTLDQHSSFLENIKAGKGVILSKNAEGGVTIDSTATGGGTTSDSTDFAFKTSATKNPLELGQTAEDQTYTVTVLDGPAQVLGGEEHLFDLVTWADVPEDSYVYIKYELWDSIGEPICEWVDGIQIASGVLPPVDDAGAKNLVFVIAKIGAGYVGYVNQYRLGGIQAVALANASPEVSEIYGVAAVSGDVDD